MAEVLDIVVRQRGARKVSRDIAKIGVAADSTNRSLKTLQTTLNRSGSALQKLSTTQNAATRATSRLSRSVDTLGTSAKRTRVSLTALGTGAALVGGAIAAGIGRPLLNSIKIAADFQQAMNLTGVKANIDRTGEAFNELKESARNLGATTQFTAVQAAEGMQFLAQSGFEASEILKAIPTVLDVAAAASIDLGRAADLSTNILRGFQLTVEQLPQAVDVLATAFTSANVDIEELAASFRKAGPVAADFNQRFEDVAAVIAALGDAGIKAGESGVALRRIFINLQQDVGKTNSILRRAGVEVRDSAGNFRPLIEIFQDISKAALTPNERIKLFGARALAAAGIIDNTAESLDNFSRSLLDGVGRTAEIAGVRLEGLAGSVRLLSSATEGLQLAIAEAGLLDFATKAVDGLTILVRSLEGLPKPILTAIGFVASLVAILATLTLKIGIIIIAMGVLGGATGLTGVASGFAAAGAAAKGFTVALLTNPIFLMIAAVTAFSIVLFKLRDDLFEVGDAQVTLRAIAEEAWDRFKTAVDIATKGAREALDRFKDSLGEVGAFISDTLSSITFNDFVAGLISAFTSGSRIIFAFLRRLAEGMAGFASDITNFFKAIPGALARAVRGDFSGAGEALAGAFDSGFTGAFDGFSEEIQGIVVQEARSAQQLLQRLGESDFFQKAAERARKRRQQERGGTQESKRTGGPLGGGGAGTTGGPVETLSEQEIERRRKALERLLDTMSLLTPVEKQLADAQTILGKAVEANIIPAEKAAVIFKQLGEQVFAKIQQESNPTAAALTDLKDKTSALAAAAAAGAIDLDQLADAERRVGLAAEKALLSSAEFTDSLEDLDLFTLGVRKGFEGFADSLGSEFEQISGLVQGTFETGLDALTEFTTQGTLNFREFATTVIADIQRVVLKLIAIQAIRAFEQREEQGGFLKGLFGGGLEATQRGVSPEVQRGIAAQGVPGTASNPASSKIINDAGSPIPVLLPLESPGVAGIKDPIVAELAKNRLANAEQLGTLAFKLDSIAQVGASPIGGAGGRVTDAVGSLGTITNTGLEATAAATATGTTNIENTNKGGFASLGGLFTSGFRSIANLFQKGGDIAGSATSGILSLIGGAVGSFFGGPAGGQIGGQVGQLGGQALQKLAGGGTIGPGQVGQAFITGDAGPELFVPPTTGQVIPNDLLGGTPPDVNVNVINVDDARAVPEAMSTREGEQVIMNVIQRNRGVLREIIS